jgi:NAD(P)-dependent dehydrogenase (short-subunit alcohol dehydrogenase family)
MTHSPPIEHDPIVVLVHDVDQTLAKRITALAPATGTVLVMDTSRDGSWHDRVEGLSRSLLERLADLPNGPLTVVTRVPRQNPNVVQAASAAAVRGTVGVAALESAPNRQRINTVLMTDATPDADLQAAMAHLADENGAGFTAGATIDLTKHRDSHSAHADLPVLVTGAAGGLGGAVAEAFAAAGRGVVISDLASNALSAQAERLGVTAIACDVTSPDDVARLAAHPEIAPGVSSLQILHGVGGSGALTALDEGVRERSLRINGTGVWNVVDALMPAVAAGNGSIVVLASQAGLISEPGNGAYCAAKFAVVGLTRALAESAPAGVRVHAICPGPIDTPLMRNAFAGMAEAAGITYDEYHARRLSVIPLGRFGHPTHVGSAALLLSQLETTAVIIAPTGAFHLT